MRRIDRCRVRCHLRLVLHQIGRCRLSRRQSVRSRQLGHHPLARRGDESALSKSNTERARLAGYPSTWLGVRVGRELGGAMKPTFFKGIVLDATVAVTLLVPTAVIAES